MSTVEPNLIPQLQKLPPQRLAEVADFVEFLAARVVERVVLDANTLVSALLPPHDPPRRLVKQDGDSRLRRRLLAIEKLDVAEKRHALHLLYAFIARCQLKRKVHAAASR